MKAEPSASGFVLCAIGNDHLAIPLEAVSSFSVAPGGNPSGEDRAGRRILENGQAIPFHDPKVLWALGFGAETESDKVVIIAHPAGKWAFPARALTQISASRSVFHPLPPDLREKCPAFQGVLETDQGLAFTLAGSWHPETPAPPAFQNQPGLPKIRPEPASTSPVRSAPTSGGGAKLLLVSGEQSGQTSRDWFGIVSSRVRAIVAVTTILPVSGADFLGVTVLNDRMLVIRDLLRTWTGIPTHVNAETRFIRIRGNVSEEDFLFPVDGDIQFRPLPAAYTPESPLPDENDFHAAFRIADGRLIFPKLFQNPG